MYSIYHSISCKGDQGNSAKLKNIYNNTTMSMIRVVTWVCAWRWRVWRSSDILPPYPWRRWCDRRADSRSAWPGRVVASPPEPSTPPPSQLRQWSWLTWRGQSSTTRSYASGGSRSARTDSCKARKFCVRYTIKQAKLCVQDPFKGSKVVVDVAAGWYTPLVACVLPGRSVQPRNSYFLSLKKQVVC